MSVSIRTVLDPEQTLSNIQAISLGDATLSRTQFTVSPLSERQINLLEPAVASGTLVVEDAAHDMEGALYLGCRTVRGEFDDGYPVLYDGLGLNTVTQTLSIPLAAGEQASYPSRVATLVAYDTDGSLRWSAGIAPGGLEGATRAAEIYAVDTQAASKVYAAGYVRVAAAGETVRYGQGSGVDLSVNLPAVPEGQDDATAGFAACYDAASGNLAWSAQFVNAMGEEMTGVVKCTSVSSAPGGSVGVAGLFSGPLAASESLGLQMYPSGSQYTIGYSTPDENTVHQFVTVLTAEGVPQWVAPVRSVSATDAHISQSSLVSDSQGAWFFSTLHSHPDGVSSVELAYGDGRPVTSASFVPAYTEDPVSEGAPRKLAVAKYSPQGALQWIGWVPLPRSHLYFTHDITTHANGDVSVLLRSTVPMFDVADQLEYRVRRRGEGSSSVETFFVSASKSCLLLRLNAQGQLQWHAFPDVPPLMTEDAIDPTVGNLDVSCSLQRAERNDVLVSLWDPLAGSAVVRRYSADGIVEADEDSWAVTGTFEADTSAMFLSHGPDVNGYYGVFRTRPTTALSYTSTGVTTLSTEASVVISRVVTPSGFSSVRDRTPVVWAASQSSVVPLLEMRQLGPGPLMDLRGPTGIAAQLRGDGHLGVGGAPSDQNRLMVHGDILFTGDLRSTSDIRLKTDIVPLRDALDRVQRMHGYKFRKIGAEQTTIGLIAQEVQAVLPEAVVEGTDGYLSVLYPNLVALLVEAIHEMQADMDQMKQRLGM